MPTWSNVCPKCNVGVPLDGDYAYSGTCRTCWSHTHASGVRKARKSNRGYVLKSRYGLTLEQYNQLKSDQRGGCAICGIRPKKLRLAVDHCHKTGRVRGLLCNPCNAALGMLRDDVDSMFAAIAYIQKARR